MHCSPPRAYVASLGAAQAFACAKEPMGLGTGKAVAVAKTHVAAEPKERRRVEAAGGGVDKDGLLNGQLPVARSLGDAAAKALRMARVTEAEKRANDADRSNLLLCAVCRAEVHEAKVTQP